MNGLVLVATVLALGQSARAENTAPTPGAASHVATTSGGAAAASDNAGSALDLRGSLPVPLIREPALTELDTSRGQSWRRATMVLSGSMCPACLLELEGKLRHTLGVNFAHVERQPKPAGTDTSKETHRIATAVVIYDKRFADLKKLEACVKDDKYKASDINEAAQW